MQIISRAFFYSEPARLIPDMAQLYILRALDSLQRKSPIIVGHSAHVAAFSHNADMWQGLTRLLVGHLSTNYGLCCHRHAREQHCQYQYK